MFVCGQKSQLSSMMSCFVEEVMCVPWYCDGDFNILNIYILLPLYTGFAFVGQQIFFQPSHHKTRG